MTKIIKMSVVVLLFMCSSAKASVLFKDLPCDISIEGNGFFKVVDFPYKYPGEVFYMRNGIIQVAQLFLLVNSDLYIFRGFVTEPYGQGTDTTVDVYMAFDHGIYSDLRIEPYAITEDGNIINGTYSCITGLNNLVGTREHLFQFSLFDFINPEGLRKIKEGIYQETVESGPPISATGSISLTNGMGRIVSNSSVPIPSGIWLFGSGITVLVGFRRKYKGHS